MQQLLSPLKIGGLLAAVVMALTAAVPPLALSWVNEARENRQSVEDRLVVLRRVQELLVDAEAGQRGYVITGSQSFLQPYHAALESLPVELQRLRDEYAGQTSRERELVDRLLTNAERRLVGLAEVVRQREMGGFAAAEPIVSSGQGKHFMDEVRRVGNELGAIEAAMLTGRDEELKRKSRYAVAFAVVSTLLNVGLLMFLAMHMVRAMRSGQAAALAARATSQVLESGMGTLRRHNDEMATLGEMARLLQTEMTLAEALEVTSVFCSRLLLGTQGSIYLLSPASDLMERAGSWGAHEAPPTLERQSCWGLRRGQTHAARVDGQLRCQHEQAPVGDSEAYTLCVPLMAYGDVLGLLNVQCLQATEAEAEHLASVARTISEQVALTLSNVKLRAVLREQSIKDPLTGLNNRRSMEESLEREIARSGRNGSPVAVVVADLDHFKAINDTHGHAVGDDVLASAARLLGTMVRACDVACRFGGEEFVLILTDCTKEAARQKAELICAAMRDLRVKSGGNGAGAGAIGITASFGVAAMPNDGDTAELLLAAADRAVYAAKHAGRNRVMSAVSTEPPLALQHAA